MNELVAQISQPYRQARTRAAVSFLLAAFFLLASASILRAATVTASWNPNPEPDIAGYKLSYGVTSGVYTTTIDVGNVTTYVVPLSPGQTYFFVVKAYDTSGLLSPNSAEVPITVPASTAPTIVSLSPTFGGIGSVVTITGANFGATKGSSTVTFNGVAATPTIWSAASIVTPVPSGASTGNVVVTVGGVASNGAPFTVNPPAPPVLTNPGNQLDGRLTPVSLQLMATDPDSPTLTYSATGLPPGLSINSTTGLISGTLTSATGTYNVSATVSDGLLSDTEPFTWTVATQAIAFVQVNYSVPTSASTVTVPIGGASATGDLNIVVVGWSDATNTVQSVTDSKGNVYTLAVGPTVLAGAETQSIYYAKNIASAAAGANTVTVTFNGTANFPDVRVVEYSGIDTVNPFNGAVGASGTTATSDSGSLATTNPNVLLFAANTVQHTTTGAGPGFTSRVITTGDGDIVEDQVVTAVGTYNATAPLTQGGWVMQLVAFGAPGGGGPVAPSIASVSPTSGPVATSVTITGTNFGATQGTSAVKFNGTTATPTSWSATSIVVPVPAGATTGNVVLTVNSLASNGVSFTVTVPPSITSLSPTSGPVATSVTVTGTNFGATQGTSTVKFNGTTATPTSWSATSIVVPVPAGATTGNVVLTVNSLASNGVSFTVTVPPSITSLSPTSGPFATSVTITGTNFGATQGTSTVKFNGTTATPTSWSATSIVVPVPAGATTGNVVVTVNGLASNGLNFTVTVAPILTSLSPANGPVGTSVTIAGANFGATQGTSTVTFNGTTATPTSWSATSIVVPVPAGATTGNVVVTVGGLASNGLSFTVNVPPTLTSLSPNNGPVGTAVTVTGTNFGATKGTSTITFNGTTATPTTWSNTSIVVPVPAGATTGNVVVTVNSLASNGLTFTVNAAPTLTNLSPTNGPVGTSVTVTGTNFGATKGTSTITFNGTTATPTTWSNTSIVVPVPAGATTGNVVVTVNSLASNGLTFTVNVPPTLTSLSPTSGAVGTPVTVTGTNFGATKGTSTITFNGTTATPTTWSATSIVVPVPSGATTGSVVVTVNGLASNGQTFTVNLAPTLTSLSPTSGAVGTSVTVTGTNFGATKGTSTIKFNGTTATPTSWSATSIVVPVPSGATTGSVIVTVNSLASNGLTFTVNVPPTLTSLSPTSGPVGTALTIVGTNFGATQGTSTITFNGTTATPTSWSATSVVVPVPVGATTGNVVVTVNALASNGVTFTVVVPTLTLGPSTTAPSGTVTVSWSNIPTPTATDWIVIAPTSAADSNWILWAYTNGASSGSTTLTLRPNTTPGSYNTRFFANDTMQRVAVSNSISVQATTVTASPASVAPGGTLTVAWQNIGAPAERDWFALAPIGAPDSSFVAWVYGTSGLATDSTVFPLPPGLSAGSYEVRLFSNDSANRLAVSNTVTVTSPAPSLEGTPVKPAPGKTLTVQWKNIAAPTTADWVGLYQAGAANTNYLVRATTNGRASDRLQMNLPGTLPPGAYELRVFSNNTFTRLATSNSLDVEPGASLSVTPISTAAGRTLNVTWSGISTPTSTDWYTLVPQNGFDSTSIMWSYTNGASSGNGTLTVPTTAPMGIYELRLYSHGSGTRMAVSNVVKIGPTVVVTPATVAPGGTVTITWDGIPTPTPGDWFSLNPLNSQDANSLMWLYADGRASDSLTFTLPASLPAGAYDLRLYSNNSANRIALSNVITVTAPGPTLTTSPIAVSNGATLTAAWSGIASPAVNNWIGLYATGAPDANFLGQVFTNGQAAGSTSIIPGALTPGSYELRLFADSAFTRLAVSNGFSVIAGAAVHAAPLTVHAGGTVTISWEGVAAPTLTDWFSLAALGSDDWVYVSWGYSTGAANGSGVTLSVPAGTAPGNYEVRFFSQNGLTRLGVSNVVVIVP